MTKYKLQHNNSTVEFVSLETATTYKNANNLQEDILQFEESVPPNITVDETIKRVINDACVFGQSVIIEVAKDNVLLGLNSTQITAILQKCAHILPLLQNGALHTAYGALLVLVADSTLPQERIDKYKLMLQQYLGL